MQEEIAMVYALVTAEDTMNHRVHGKGEWEPEELKQAHYDEF